MYNFVWDSVVFDWFGRVWYSYVHGMYTTRADPSTNNFFPLFVFGLLIFVFVSVVLFFVLGHVVLDSGC